MKNTILAAACLLLLFASCKKETTTQNLLTPNNFKEYIIPQGQHYATENPLKAVETSEMKFLVRFDSSAVYQTTDPENQYDINKLYGFSDNGDQHQKYSARIGWRWSEGALRLFGYTYNAGIRDSKEIAVIPIGKEVACSIKVTAETYQFSVDGKTEFMSRKSTTSMGKGYQLYPYFGGDETAPHDVHIWIGAEK